MNSDSRPICRVLNDFQGHSGAWNMAVDEVLLDAAVDDGRCSLRWYEWNTPTVSLGYFQDRSAVRTHAQLADLPVVRRLSGGGAIVHDQEWTYSCALPASHPFTREPRELYTLVHRCVIEVLRESGVNARIRGERNDERAKTFLCFSRTDAFDVVVDGYKILGSAQRRRKGAVLQHGSLVLRRSSHAPDFKGLYDLTPEMGGVETLLPRLADALARLLAPEVAQGELSPAEVDAVRRIASGGHAGD